MLISYSFEPLVRQEMFGGAGTREKKKQSTELTAMLGTDMHVIWLGWSLFYRCG